MNKAISHLPPFEDFQEKFQQAFGRDMTREERRFYRLVNIVLEEEFLGQYQRASTVNPLSRALRSRLSSPLEKSVPS